jgi:hypothetical protein
MTKTSLSVIPLSRLQGLSEENDNVIAPYVRIMSAAGWTIPVWMGPTFWANVRNPTFRKLLSAEIGYSLSNSIRAMKPLDPTPAAVTSFMLSLVHLHVCYAVSFDPASLDTECEGMASGTVADLIAVIRLLRPADMATLLDHMIVTQQVELLVRSLPVFSLFAILGRIRTEFADFLSACAERLSQPISDAQLQVMVHVMGFCLNFDAPITNAIVAHFRKGLLLFLARPEPTGSLCCNLVISLERQLQFPGYCLFNSLQWALEFNEPTGGHTPLVFDATLTPYLGNFMYSTTVDDTSVSGAMLSFLEFFLSRYFVTDRRFTPDELCLVLEVFSMDEGELAKFGADNEMPVNPDPDHRPSPPPPLLPIIPVQPLKLGALDLRMDTLTPFGADAFLFLSARQLVFKKMVFESLRKGIVAKHNTGILLEFRFLVFGDDHLLSDVMTSMLANIVSDPIFSQVIFCVYFVPIGDSEIGDFIAGFDPIYDRWVRTLYSIVTRIVPIGGENVDTAVIIPSLEDAGADYEPNIWFADRTPNHMLQFGVQHYLYFAREFVELNIWQCLLRLTDGHSVVVPFIVGVGLPNELRHGYEVDGVDVGRSTLHKITEKGAALQLWAAKKESRVRPSDQWILMESERDVVMLLAARICHARGQPFSVTVDGQSYGPVVSIAVSYLKDEHDGGEQRKFRVATFLPFLT